MKSQTDWEVLQEKTDEDIIEPFKQGRAGYQSRINDVLRAYGTSKRLEGKGSE